MLVIQRCQEQFYHTLRLGCNLIHSNAHHCLHHVHPPGPHFIDKLKDVEVISLLQSLHHCIKSDESASATHTSTEGVYRSTLQKHKHTIIRIKLERYAADSNKFEIDT